MRHHYVCRGLVGLPPVAADERERKILKRSRVSPASPVLLLVVEPTVYILHCAGFILAVQGKPAAVRRERRLKKGKEGKMTLSRRKMCAIERKMQLFY